MVVISKLFPLVCFSWICEIPCRTKPPLKLVTEFVTEFCDRTQTSQSAGLWPISLSSQVPPSWTPPPSRSACFFTIIFLPALIIIICPQDLWPLASSSHTPPFLPTVMSDCEGGGRMEQRLFRAKISLSDAALPLEMPPLSQKIYFGKLLKLRNLAHEFFFSHLVIFLQ